MCYFTCEAQKLPLNAIVTWFLVLGKIQVYSKDYDHCWWRHRPPAAPPSTKGKIVSKYCNITKNLGRGPSKNPTPPPPPPCTTVGVWVYAYVRGLIVGCKLRDEDCSANVFSSKPWSVMRIIFITYIKAKSNYILESVLIVCYLWLGIKTHGRRQWKCLFVLSQRGSTSCQRYDSTANLLA